MQIQSMHMQQKYAHCSRYKQGQTAKLYQPPAYVHGIGDQSPNAFTNASSMPADTTHMYGAFMKCWTVWHCARHKPYAWYITTLHPCSEGIEHDTTHTHVYWSPQKASDFVDFKIIDSFQVDTVEYKISHLWCMPFVGAKESRQLMS